MNTEVCGQSQVFRIKIRILNRLRCLQEVSKIWQWNCGWGKIKDSEYSNRLEDNLEVQVMFHLKCSQLLLEWGQIRKVTKATLWRIKTLIPNQRKKKKGIWVRSYRIHMQSKEIIRSWFLEVDRLQQGAWTVRRGLENAEMALTCQQMPTLQNAWSKAECSHFLK